MDTDKQDFSSFLKDRLRDRGVSLRRASEVTGIPPNYLENLVYGETEKLPPGPYLRGYLVKLGRLLDFDPEVWWKELKESQTLKTAGSQDKLPQNRFALKTTSKYLWVAVVIIAVAIYLGFRFYPILGKPQVSVRNPGEALISLTEDSVNVSGTVEGSDKVLINGEEIATSEGGEWQKRLPLQPGLNTIEIVAKKFLGGETRVLRQVVYEVPIKVELSQ